VRLPVYLRFTLLPWLPVVRYTVGCVLDTRFTHVARLHTATTLPHAHTPFVLPVAVHARSRLVPGYVTHVLVYRFAVSVPFWVPRHGLVAHATHVPAYPVLFTWLLRVLVYVPPFDLVRLVTYLLRFWFPLRYARFGQVLFYVPVCPLVTHVTVACLCRCGSYVGFARLPHLSFTRWFVAVYGLRLVLHICQLGYQFTWVYVRPLRLHYTFGYFLGSRTVTRTGLLVGYALPFGCYRSFCMPTLHGSAGFTRRARAAVPVAYLSFASLPLPAAVGWFIYVLVHLPGLLVRTLPPHTALPLRPLPGYVTFTLLHALPRVGFYACLAAVLRFGLRFRWVTRVTVYVVPLPGLPSCTVGSTPYHLHTTGCTLRWITDVALLRLRSAFIWFTLWLIYVHCTFGSRTAFTRALQFTLLLDSWLRFVDFGCGHTLRTGGRTLHTTLRLLRGLPCGLYTLRTVWFTRCSLDAYRTVTLHTRLLRFNTPRVVLLHPHFALRFGLPTRTSLRRAVTVYVTVCLVRGLLRRTFTALPLWLRVPVVTRLHWLVYTVYTRSRSHGFRTVTVTAVVRSSRTHPV